MRAIRFEAVGDPSVLKVMQMAAPAANESTALVRIMAASINPSDVKNVAGAMKQTTLPRIPGRDFAGVVEAGPAKWLGQWGVYTLVGLHVGATVWHVAIRRDGLHDCMLPPQDRSGSFSDGQWGARRRNLPGFTRINWVQTSR